MLTDLQGLRMNEKIRNPLPKEDMYCTRDRQFDQFDQFDQSEYYVITASISTISPKKICTVYEPQIYLLHTLLSLSSPCFCVVRTLQYENRKQLKRKEMIVGNLVSVKSGDFSFPFVRLFRSNWRPAKGSYCTVCHDHPGDLPQLM